MTTCQLAWLEASQYGPIAQNHLQGETWTDRTAGTPGGPPASGTADEADARSTSKDQAANAACTVLIEDRTFFRECVLASLTALEPDHAFHAFESVEAWARSPCAGETSLLVFWVSAPTTRSQPEGHFAARMKQVQQLPSPPPVAVLSDQESAACISEVMNAGARAFLPASMSVEVTLKVLALVRAGGTFIPATMLSAATHSAAPSADTGSRALEALLSPRQLDVARAMRKGLPNKVIAYELAMSESTVKVHVRTIMRKLNARNRTEVAFLTQSLDSDRAGEPDR